VKRKSRERTAEAVTLHAYLRDLAKLPRLNPDQERELGDRIRQHGDPDAIRELVEANLRFVVSYAKRYRGLGVSYLDLIHEGNLGLVEAARRFEPSHNVKFITYAVWWVRQSIMHALSGQRRAVALPARLSAVARRFGQEVADLTRRLDHAPSAEEIAEDLDISPSQAEALQFVAGVDVSLSDPVGQDEEGSRELGDTLAQQAVPSPADDLFHHTLLAQVRLALGELDAKEREVVVRRFGLHGGDPETLQQIGDDLGLSRERVRQIEARAKERLRRSFRAGGLRGYLN
jgi:RNA polymerase primary sigma factor